MTEKRLPFQSTHAFPLLKRSSVRTQLGVGRSRWCVPAPEGLRDTAPAQRGLWAGGASSEAHLLAGLRRRRRAGYMRRMPVSLTKRWGPVATINRDGGRRTLAK